MLGIRTEAVIFFYAWLSGCILFIVYQVLIQMRKLIRHSIVMINLEDFLFWMGTGGYLFRQMYRTTHGTIRWFFLLGVILCKCMVCETKSFLICILRANQRSD